MKKFLILTLMLVLTCPVLAKNRPGVDSDSRKEPITNRFQNCSSGKKFVCPVVEDLDAGLTKRKCSCVPAEVKNKSKFKKKSKKHGRD